MKILAVGDIVRKTGLQKLKEELPIIVKENKIDFVIVNGENTADGMGLLEKQYKEILNLSVDVVTMGNHTWAKKEIFKFIEDERIVRPANYSKNNPGKGYRILTCKSNKKKIAVINLIGRVGMNILSENPFIVAKDIVENLKNTVDIIVIDMHAEATAEKIALYHYLDGKVTIVFGTHTHVQTADEEISDKGTGFLSDLGMTGPKSSVIGMDINTSIKRFETSLPEKYKIAEGKAKLNACMFEVDDVENKVVNIVRINK